MRNTINPHIVKALHRRRHRQFTQRISDPGWSNNALAGKTAQAQPGVSATATFPLIPAAASGKMSRSNAVSPLGDAQK
jgi:hypothetical protein